MSRTGSVGVRVIKELKKVMLDALQKTLLVGVGGFLGANARYWLGLWMISRYGTSFPWATFVINVSGAFVLGFFLTVGIERFFPSSATALTLIFAVGFLGAYTTFSTFEYETLHLIRTGALLPAFGNALGSLIAGFAAVWLGEVVARSV